jgi:hypothetical protein
VCEPFATADTNYALRHYAVCGITACEGSVVVANVCEEFTGRTMLHLYDDEDTLVAMNVVASGDTDSVDDDSEDSAVDGDTLEAYYAYDDDFGEGGVGMSDDYYYEGSSECEPVKATCSKLRYVIPTRTSTGTGTGTGANTTVCRTYYLRQGCFGRGSCAACSGRTRVAGGIAAPTAQPTTLPTSSPSTIVDWKESMYVFTFKVQIKLILWCDECQGQTKNASLDEPAQEAFREVFVSSMTNKSVTDVDTLKVFNTYIESPDGQFPITVGTFAIREVSSNRSAIPAMVKELSDESSELFSTEYEQLGVNFIELSVTRGSVIVHENMTAVFISHVTSKDFEVEEVQTYAPTGEPTVIPSSDPTSSPPTSQPSRGSCLYACMSSISVEQFLSCMYFLNIISMLYVFLCRTVRMRCICGYSSKSRPERGFLR